MKEERQFKTGDKVFAKVKGYPAWPAIVLEENGKKYKVRFYGTGETGHIKAEDLFYYNKNKAKFLKSSKRKDFNDSIQEIEEAIKVAGTDGNPNANDDKADDSLLNSSLPADTESSNETKKRKRSVSRAKSVDEASKAKKGKLSLAKTKSNSASPVNESNGGPIDVKSDVPTVEAAEKEEVSKPTEDDEKVNHETLEPEKKAPEVSTESTVSEITLIDKVEPKDYVMEKELEAFIEFGNHVEKHKDIYSNMSVEERYDSKMQILPFLHEKTSIGVKLYETWPLAKFENEYDRAIYDKEVSQNVLNLKKSFSQDELKENPSKYYLNLEISEDDLDKCYKEKLLNIKEDILEKLQVENSLLEIDTKIKSCLNLDKAEPKKAIVLLEEMLTLKLNEIMLKKHAHVVDVVRRLRKYVGNVESWNLSDEEKKTFKKDAEIVRNTALKVYVKFMQIVGKPPTAETFWDAFNTIATKFREDTKDLSEPEFYMLSSEPFSRKNFLNNYFVKAMPLNIPFKNNLTKDTESVKTAKEDKKE